MIHRLNAALLLLIAPASGWAQQQPQSPPAAESDPVAAIDAEFAEKFRELERQRLGQLAQLASQSEGPQAARVYESYFRSALGAGLFQEAEPVAQGILGGPAPSPVVRYLAEVVNIMAEADRGDFEASLESIVRAEGASIEAGDDGGELARRSLPASARLSLLDTYYQRLAQAGQYEIARKAFATIRQNAQEGSEPAVLAYLDNRIRQLDMIGRPAPSFEGVDIDGQPVRLADFAGKPVLLVFWATWYRPNAEQVAWMKDSYSAYRDQGLQVVGVNLDALAEGGRPVDGLIPELRSYVLEHNIPWPNIVTEPGDGNIAAAYGVSEIPANVLINGEGQIAALDLNRTNFSREVDKVLGGSE